MNKHLASLIVTLLVFPHGAISGSAAGDKVTEPQAAPAGMEPPPAASAVHKAMEETEMTKASAPATPPEPITGAFGIPLGKPFQPSMVARVLSEQEQTYSGQGGKKLQGNLLRVEPGKPDKRFQHYYVKTTSDGIIYAIQGDYQTNKVKQEEIRPAAEKEDKAKPDPGIQDETKPIPEMQDKAKADEAKPKGKGKGAGKPGNRKQAKAIQATCKATVKTMAKELEARYGKPRGQGWDGLWFVFRQFSDSSNLSLRLYGHRCRTGMYSIIYTDEKVQRGIVPGKAGTSAKGPVDAGKASTKPIPSSESES